MQFPLSAGRMTFMGECSSQCIIINTVDCTGFKLTIGEHFSSALANFQIPSRVGFENGIIRPEGKIGARVASNFE